jgi:alpha-glucosidase (family GH31 glycosyl hydrolase)
MARRARANDAQVNALMPAMQFSIAPWDLSKDAETMCRQAVELRERLLHTILAVAEEAGHALEPICRPMWWLDPEDEQTYQIKDQFVVGDELIVAPVVYRVRRGFDSSLRRLPIHLQRREGSAGQSR